MADLIDATAEAERLAKLIARAQSDLDKVRARLANDNFVRNAPEAVVNTERQRLAELEQTVGRLTSQLERVRNMPGPGPA